MGCASIGGQATRKGLDRNAESASDDTLMAVILVVEDDFFLLQGLEGVLEDLGYDALLASDLAGALVHLDNPCRIDALFVDVRLAALSLGGYDVANQALGLRPDLPVLYTSGSALCSEMTGRFVPGGHFLQKPYSPAQLNSSLGALLQ